MRIDPSTLTYQAILTDGNRLDPAGLAARGGFRGAIERGDFAVLVVLTTDGDEVARVVPPEGARPIFGWLRTQSLNPAKPAGLEAVVFGWQETINGRNKKTLMWVTSDGMTLTDRSLSEIEAF